MSIKMSMMVADDRDDEMVQLTDVTSSRLRILNTHILRCR